MELVAQAENSDRTAVVCYMALILLPLFITKYYILAIAGLITLMISIITYAVSNTEGSMWCWIANLSWLFIIGFIAADKCFENLLCKNNKVL